MEILDAEAPTPPSASESMQENTDLERTRLLAPDSEPKTLKATDEQIIVRRTAA